MSKSGTIKVTFNSDTKRMPAPDSYQQLLETTHQLFPQAQQALAVQGQSSTYKFYFLDEDQDLIQINSQDEFNDNREYIQTDAADEMILTVPTLIYSDSASSVKRQLMQLKQSRQMLMSGISFDGASMFKDGEDQ